MPEVQRTHSFSLPSYEHKSYGPTAASCVTSGVPGVGGASSQDLIEFKMLRQQRSQINQLTQCIAALQTQPRHPGFSRESIICRQCEGPGHYGQECDGKRVVRQSHVTSVTGISHPGGQLSDTSQPSEN